MPDQPANSSEHHLPNGDCTEWMALGPDAVSEMVEQRLRSSGEHPIDEDEEQTLYEMGCFVLAMSLIRRGVDPETAVKAVDQAAEHGDLLIALNDGQLSITMGHNSEEADRG